MSLYFTTVTTYPGGTPVSSGGSTTSTGLDVNGAGALPNGSWELLDNNVLVAWGTANQSGGFNYQLLNLTPGVHHLQLRENASLPTTADFVITVVVQQEKLTLDDVKTQDTGVSVPPGGSTDSQVLVVSGTGEVDGVVKLLDNGASIGVAIVDSQGNWTIVTPTLAIGSHSLVAQAVYGSNPVTPARTLTVVVADDAPTIDSMRGGVSGTPIFNGGDTFEARVNMTGTAAKEKSVNVFDGATFVGRSTADSGGVWTLLVPLSILAVYRFRAVADYGSGQSSAVWLLSKLHEEDFETVTSQVITVGRSIDTAAFSIIYAKGAPDIQVAVFRTTDPQGAVNGQTLQLSHGYEGPYSAAITVDLQMKSSCSRVSFWTASVSQPAYVDFFNPAGALLGTLAIPNVPVGSILHLTDFSAPNISRVSFRATGKDWFHVDTIRCWPISPVQEVVESAANIE